MLNHIEVSNSYNTSAWPNRQKVDAQLFSAMGGCQTRDKPLSGIWCNPHVHYFNLAMLDRPIHTLGRIEGSFENMQPIGEILLVPAGLEFTGTGGAGKQSNLVVLLHAEATTNSEPPKPITTGQLRACHDLRNHRIRNLLRQIAHELFYPDASTELMLEGLGYTLAGETARLFQPRPVSPPRLGGLSPSTMRLINDRIAEANQQPSLAELAALCNLSQRHLMRAFQEETGQTLGSYVKQQIISTAGQLLSHSDMPIGEIAKKLGFSSTSAFSKTFRRHRGIPPREFRHSFGITD